MAAVDPYSPCPCGSQEKYKWCCQKAEEPALRAERLIRSEQLDQALKVIDEGLGKVRDAFWLLLQKAIVHERREEYEAAAGALKAVLDKKPDHLGALAQRVQLALIAEGPRRAVDELQSALGACKAEDRPQLGGIFRLVGIILARTERLAAALAHLEIAAETEPEDDPMARQALRSMMTDPAVSPWLKNPYELHAAPESLNDADLDRFEAALEDADEVLWARAASQFEALSADGVPEADFNLGICRLWTADDRGAVEALRRHHATLEDPSEAVDLEALCQQLEPLDDDDLVEHVRLIWPLADRPALLKALADADGGHGSVVAEGQGVMDPDDPGSTEVDVFSLLDRPRGTARTGIGPEEIARVIGRVLVGNEIVALDGHDLGKQFDALRERFTALAGGGIPPSHPRTKVLEKVSRVGLMLRTEWVIPEGLDNAEVRRIQGEEQARVLREVWPETPLPGLVGRTPRQAAEQGGLEVPLRAAFCLVEAARSIAEIDHDAVRAEIGIPPEPTPDPESVDIEGLHLARLFRITAERLDDDRLWRLYLRARATGQQNALERACRALFDRPMLLDARSASERFAVLGDLANIDAIHGRKDGALAVIERARAVEPADHRAPNAARWDFLALRIRARFESPEAWVPELAVIMDRYRDDRPSSQPLISNLVEMGLIQMVPHPDHPDQMMLDSRPLMALLGEYGPRISTASGELGVSASKPGIWTPGSGAGARGGGGLWTPSSGQGAPPEGERKIIYPGR